MGTGSFSQLANVKCRLAFEEFHQVTEVDMTYLQGQKVELTL